MERYIPRGIPIPDQVEEKEEDSDCSNGGVTSLIENSYCDALANQTQCGAHEPGDWLCVRRSCIVEREEGGAHSVGEPVRSCRLRGH